MIDTGDDRPAALDTNIIVYAYDASDAAKHEAAKDLIVRLSDTGRLVLSTQVLNEFASVMMRPRRETPLEPGHVRLILERLAATATVVPVTPSITLRALDTMTRHSLSFWDALIWAAAKENGVAILDCEDFQDGRDIEGVRIVNPLANRPAGA